VGATETSRNSIQIYPYEQILIRATDRLKTSTDISESNREDIVKLVQHLQARGLSRLRVSKYIYTLIVLARMAGEPLRHLGKEDVERLVARINVSSYAEETKHNYKVVLKKFYHWLRGCDEEEHEYPIEVKWIKTTIKKKRLLSARIPFFMAKDSK
jgi:hypothetical protein